MANGEDAAVTKALVGSTFCAERDTYSPIGFPLGPLSFDRVNDGHSVPSNCPIFRLPVELYPSILDHLDAGDLASLALLDRDCRQLARSVQFMAVHLSISRWSLQFLTHVFYEGLVGNERPGTPDRRIGVCVRRLVVSSNQEHVRSMISRENGSATSEKITEMVADMHRTITSFITFCLPTSFPNVELFQFADDVAVPSDLFNGLSVTRLRHLALDNLSVALVPDNAIVLAKGVVALSAWSGMQTLSLYLDGRSGLDRHDVKWDEIKRPLLTILHAVAPSLEGLLLSGVKNPPYDFVSSLPQFPRLKRLHIEGCRRLCNEDNQLLRGLLPIQGAVVSSLQSLQLDRIDSAHLIRLGCLPYLTRLVVNDISLSHGSTNFGFLATNPQLELLSFTFPVKSETLRTRLLPTIHSSRFSSLRVLRLISASTRISKRAITAIGMISSLEMLWLSAGQQYGWKHDWFVNHISMREGLKSLQRLREVAFSRESYHCKEYRIQDAEEIRSGYYVYPLLPPGITEASVLMGEDEVQLPLLTTHDDAVFFSRYYVWEKWHRGRMLDIASEYAHLFPKLTFIFAGEYPMEVVRGERAQDVRKIVTLTEGRTPCLALLNEKWGSQTV